MPRRGGTAHKILVWSYERGTWQYDVLCGLILAFVFLVPKSCFVKRETASPAAQSTVQSQPPVTSPTSSPR